MSGLRDKRGQDLHPGTERSTPGPPRFLQGLAFPEGESQRSCRSPVGPAPALRPRDRNSTLVLIVRKEDGQRTKIWGSCGSWPSTHWALPSARGGFEWFPDRLSSRPPLECKSRPSSRGEERISACQRAQTPATAGPQKAPRNYPPCRDEKRPRAATRNGPEGPLSEKGETKGRGSLSCALRRVYGAYFCS